MSASTNSSTSESQEETFLREIQRGCHALTPLLRPSYGYVPSFAGGIVFCVLFGIPLLYHTFQSCRLRKGTSILLALGALTELIGWASRTYAAKCPYNANAFLAQEVTLIIAPVFFSAALYVLLRNFIVDIGRGTSILSAKWYTIIFCTSDLISLIAQAAGGAMASMAGSGPSGKHQSENGTHIMVAGIAFQLGTMTLFGFFMADFARRIESRRRGFREAVTSQMKWVLWAMLVSFVMIYVRSIYRTIELAQGWSGYLITHEVYFIVLDAAIMVIAVAVFVVIDPTRLLPRDAGYTRAKQLPSAEALDAELVQLPTPYSSQTKIRNSGAQF